jgi:hypothetical protein
MQAKYCLVTKLPLQELWDKHGVIKAERLRPLSTADMRELLRGGPVIFVIADVGRKLYWVPEDRCFYMWKKEVQPHLSQPDKRVALEEFPDDYCYFASEWSINGGPRYVLLERHH